MTAVCTWKIYEKIYFWEQNKVFFCLQILLFTYAFMHTNLRNGLIDLNAVITVVFWETFKKVI